MPASPSFPSGRGKLKRRKRPHQQPKHDELDDEDEDDAVFDDSVDIQNPHSITDPNPNFTVANEVVADGGVRICDFPPVTKLEVNRPHASVMAIVGLEKANLTGSGIGSGRVSVPCLENVSYGQLQAVSAVPVPESDQDRSDGGNSAAVVVTPPKIMEGKGVVKRYGSRAHAVPMHSDWFAPSSIHRLERQVVPHFFSGKSPDHTPEKYMECRNFVVAKYMQSPEMRLEVNDCQGLVAGVSNEDLTRIVRFLEHWGVINYCADRPSREFWSSGSYLREDSNGEVHVPSATLKSVDSLIKFDKPKCRLRAADVYSLSSPHDDGLNDLDDRIRERLSENHCTYCSRPLSRLYYQSQKDADVMLCSDCFHEGRFVEWHSSLDFVKVDTTKNYGDADGETWSDQETLLLLEAMEIYKENWNEIAEHVGTKSKAQCILHFLRMPVEDGLLENFDVPSLSKSCLTNKDEEERPHSSSNGSCPQDADSESSLPFENSGNPVMALVAVLASAVGPRVAAACAHASLTALSEDNRVNLERRHSGEGGHKGEVSNSNQHREANTHNSRDQNEGEVTPLSEERVKTAAKAGLSAAATKAKLFADHEEREIQRLSANIINHRLKRLELKLKQFAEIETFLMRECDQVEKTRQRFAAERMRILSTRLGSAASSTQMNLSGAGSGPGPAPGPSLINNNISNNRQQGFPSSTPQQNIPGYVNSQQAHPHVPFMQRAQQQQQPMFPMGPRMPLSAIQPSSSTPSNAAFNTSGNSQASLNQMLRSMSGPGNGLG